MCITKYFHNLYSKVRQYNVIVKYHHRLIGTLSHVNGNTSFLREKPKSQSSTKLKHLNGPK